MVIALSKTARAITWMQHPTLRHTRVFAAFLLLAVLAWPTPTQETPDVEKKNVLVVYDEQDKLPGLAVLDKGIRSTLLSAKSVKVDVYSENLDRSRFRDKDYDLLLADYFDQKYNSKKIDAIIAVMGPSLDFLLAQENEFSPGTPIIFCGVDRRELESHHLNPNVTGILLQREFKGTMDTALKLQPNTKRAIFIGGSSAFDERLNQQARSELRTFEDRIAVEYWTDFELNDLLKKVSQLPPDTILFVSTVFRDNTGKSFVPHDVVSQISNSANVPVYGFLDQFVGRGIVGGRVYSTEAHGNKVAALALRVLEGENPSEIPIEDAGGGADMFDWREMQRWGISEEALPVGAVVQFRELSAWEQFRPYLAIAISILFLQTFLIVSLLLSKRLRRKAELERSEFKTMAVEEHARLGDVLANVPGIVWESRRVDETGRRRAVFISSYVEQMLGYSVEECLADPEFIASKIVPEDREAYQSEADSIFLTGESKTVQFRCTTKSGDWKWVESYVIPVSDELGKSIGLRGVTMDISERKKAEENLGAKERQLTEAQRLAQVGSWEWSPETDTVVWSEEIYRIYGMDPREPAAAYAKHGELYTPESWHRLGVAVAEALRSGTPYELELEIVRVDGRHGWGRARGEAVQNGRGIKLRGTLQDITARKKAEEAIRESEARFRNLADTAPVNLWMADPDMATTFFNQYFLQYTGETMENVVGDGWLRLIHPDDRQPYIDAYSLASKNRKPFKIEFRVQRVDGEYRWVYGTAAPRFTMHGEFLGYIGSFVDISDRRMAEDGLKAALEQIYELKNQLHEENIYLKEVMKLEHHYGDIVGSSDALKYVLFKIEQVAPTDSTVLITGETGTGKELVARAIHSTSLRSDRPLVRVNCAALSATLVESELFGHERGAFTGAASRKIGRFELADGATIFLDEIGELPLELQVKLLRVLQEGEFERLGSSKTLKTDVRIMAATNRNLEAEVRAGRFREDLLFRLNVFPVTVPPLRERKEDIPELVEHFVSQFSKKLGKTITSVSPSTLRSLKQYHWPGNVRELANVIERAVIGTSGDTLRVVDKIGDQVPREDTSDDLPESLESVERKHIIKTLQSTNWRIQGPQGAARILGVNPSTLRTRMSKLGIVRSDSHFV